jgi:hypothetical protein
MKAFLLKNKGYIIHGAAVGIAFLDPSVRTWLASHASYAALGGTAWGWLLHWANGK